jgi:hypothetical protein
LAIFNQKLGVAHFGIRFKGLAAGGALVIDDGFLGIPGATAVLPEQNQRF